MIRFAITIAACIVAFLAAAPQSHAINYVVGNHPIELLNGPCLPEQALVMYTQQTPGEAPVVGETFWVGVKVSFNESFACAADFWAAELTLPANLTPSISASSAPICIRTGVNGQGVQFTDQRAAANCPIAVGGTGLTWNPGTRVLRIGPKPAATFPDFGDPTSRFFLGQASGESVEYKEMVVWVPVKATAAIAAQPMTALVCTNGMGCSSTWNGTTAVFNNITVNSTAPPLVDLNINPDVWTSPTGINLQYFLKFSGGGDVPMRLNVKYYDGDSYEYICGYPTANSYTDYNQESNLPDTSHLVLLGSLDWSSLEAQRCYLPPATQHQVQICHNIGGGLCRTINFSTSAVITEFSPLTQTATHMPLSSQLNVTGRKVQGAHTAGDAYMRYRPITGGTWLSTTPKDPVMKSDSENAVALPDRTLSTEAWSRYELESCFDSSFVVSHTMCTPTSQVTAGYIVSPDEATGVTHNAATVQGLPTAPWPAGTMTVRARTGASGEGDPAGDTFTQIGSVNTSAWLTPSAGTPTTIALTGLASSTTYHWAVCFDAPATPGIEDCSAIRTFTTAAAPTGDENGDNGGSKPAAPTLPPARLVNLVAGKPSKLTAIARTGTIKVRLPASIPGATKAKVTIRLSRKQAKTIGLNVPRKAKFIQISAGTFITRAGKSSTIVTRLTRAAKLRFVAITVRRSTVKAVNATLVLVLSKDGLSSKALVKPIVLRG